MPGQKTFPFLLFSEFILSYGFIYLYLVYETRFSHPMHDKLTSISCAHSWVIEGIDYDPVHHCLATSAGNGIKVWDLTSTWFSTIRHHFSNHEETCCKVQFIESGNVVAATFMEMSKLYFERLMAILGLPGPSSRGNGSLNEPYV
ncbi:hypothetical protein M422DRAFT_49545 [Sphaerobolus stellatus SS14]|uniref:Uncharacterized protein n=1 Tax=Sphaerobolus stellatus (strain SS14) TaxID=990650 RepID=A0A0C9UXU2_SPHS4|nr:hypothetical protein M422DRAFT_49545 [Sphaerobolus stellatus SS14]